MHVQIIQAASFIPPVSAFSILSGDHDGPGASHRAIEVPAMFAADNVIFKSVCPVSVEHAARINQIVRELVSPSPSKF
jgi:hypothetical protein